jgi:heme/copper-type cytochrome/quinol oxidase subunit 2
MPTDLDVVSARKREAEAQKQALVTIMVVWGIICLVVLGLLFKVVGSSS